MQGSESMLASQQIVEMILRLICKKPSDSEELKQNDLADALGVSRMPVREALALLSHDGYVLRLSNRHVHTYSLTNDFLRENISLFAAAESELFLALRNRRILMDELICEMRATGLSATQTHQMFVNLCPNPYLKITLTNMLNGYFSAFCEIENYQDAGAFPQLLERCQNALQSEVIIMFHEYFDAWMASCGDIKC